MSSTTTESPGGFDSGIMAGIVFGILGTLTVGILAIVICFHKTKGKSRNDVLESGLTPSAMGMTHRNPRLKQTEKEPKVNRITPNWDKLRSGSVFIFGRRNVPSYINSGLLSDDETPIPGRENRLPENTTKVMSVTQIFKINRSDVRNSVDKSAKPGLVEKEKPQIKSALPLNEKDGGANTKMTQPEVGTLATDKLKVKRKKRSKLRDAGGSSASDLENEPDERRRKKRKRKSKSDIQVDGVENTDLRDRVKNMSNDEGEISRKSQKKDRTKDNSETKIKLDEASVQNVTGFANQNVNRDGGDDDLTERSSKKRRKRNSKKGNKNDKVIGIDTQNSPLAQDTVD